MQTPTRARRIQLSADEKKVMAERIKTDRSDANLLSLVQEWNKKYPERSINWNHLKRIRDDIPLISTPEEFWDSVSSEVERILPQVTSQKNQPKSKADYDGRPTKVVDAEKVPWITEAQAAPFKFNFKHEAYSSESSSANH
jgi:hypothetical protein